MSTLNILNVGVGGGHEAIALFSNCTHITFVDIVQSSLEKIKEHIPLSKIIVSIYSVNKWLKKEFKRCII